MLNIGNKKLKMSNVGTTPLDSIYLGSTLIWKQKYLQWYDPEFKRVICRAKVPPTMELNDPELEIINPNLTENEKLMYPFKNGIKHLYVPDESVNLYKNDNQYTNSYTVYTEENPIVKYKKINVKKALGNVRCWDGIEIKERNIGLSRFKDIIKPLSEYVES